MRYLSPREKVAAGVALSVVYQLRPGKPPDGAEGEVSDVASEDPVVGPLVPVPVPAGVCHGVEEVLTRHPSGRPERSRVNGLVPGEEPGVGGVTAAAHSASHSAAHSLGRGDAKGH